MARSALMRTYCRPIDHHPLQVRILQRLKDVLPDNAFGPSVGALINEIPVAKALRQVPPRDTGARDPEHGVDKEAVTGGNATGVGGPAGKERRDALPLIVTNGVALHRLCAE